MQKGVRNLFRIKKVVGALKRFLTPFCMLFASALQAQVTFVPQQRGGMEAVLTVRAAKQAAVQGLGEVTLTLMVKGPAALEVEEPHLGDPTAAWKEERLTRSLVVQGMQATWSQDIRLRQVKPGAATVPEVSLRFREGPNADWQEAKWVNILKDMREGPRPPVPVDRPSWLQRWGFVLILGLTGVLIIGAWLVKRRRIVQPPPLSPEQFALHELERIEAALPPEGDATTVHTELSQVLRRYLAERFGLHAWEQTTAELLEAIRQHPAMSAEVQKLLSDWFTRCDLAKFARLYSSPEECRQTIASAREVVAHSATESAGNSGGASPAVQ